MATGALNAPVTDLNFPMDTALALDPTLNRDHYLSKLQNDVDALSHLYTSLRNRNDKWNQLIMVISSLGALITSVLTIANLTGWPYEVVPIVIQTLSGVMAAWMRFYDFPKRMEAIINAKHYSNDVREKMHKSAVVSEELWELYCTSARGVDEVMTPQERDVCHVAALKYRERQMYRTAMLNKLLRMTDNELIERRSRSRWSSKVDSSSETSSVDEGTPLVRTSGRPNQTLRLGRRVTGSPVIDGEFSHTHGQNEQYKAAGDALENVRDMLQESTATAKNQREEISTESQPESEACM
jgi:hypothetical protein